MKKGYLFFLALILIGLAGEAWAVPPLPHTFYGTVKKDGNNVPDGTVIGAWIGGFRYGLASTFTFGTDSVYRMHVLADDPDSLLIEGGVNGDNVSFRTGNNIADQSSVFSSGDITNLPLTFATDQTIETVSIPDTPSGPTIGTVGNPYDFLTTGSTSSLGDPMEYQFDWEGDGTVLSSWGTANRSKSWSVPGTYFVRVRARCSLHSSILSFWSLTLTVRILPPTPAVDNPPFGFFDIPVPDSILSGVVQVGGWALDDVMVTKVELRSDMSFWPYIGDLYYTCGTRPDVAALYPTLPNNTCAGWGYMWLTNFMSATIDPQTGQPLEGTTHQFYLRIYDTGGHTTDVGHRNITILNNPNPKPFGAIDVPLAEEIVSGPINVMGWALAKGGRRVTQVLVRLDGVSLGQVNYGLNWPALAQVFPVSIYPYSENAAYAYSLDTTRFSNGQHALDVVVIDESGNLEGIGSRYIYIQN